jgi:Cd2+/Zn2+-exporting ATPase
MLIGGEWVLGDEGTTPIINPATEEIVGYAPEASVAQAEAAAQAAQDAFPKWWRTPPVERARLLQALADTLREDAADVVRQLRENGIERIVMLTGDHRNVANAIGREAGVDEVHAELMPEDKWRIIQSLKASGPVAMIGDGVNDAPALAAADIGIAMGAAGTDVAMETADVVLMGEQLKTVAYAIAISKAARRIVRQNLVFSMSVIVVLVIAALGYNLALPAGVIGHEGSTVVVCLNGLRLLRFRA